jgi:RNA polymerase sigma factor (sigma-70 family)
LDNAARIMESEENRKKMRDAILRLDKPCQKVLFDYWWEGKSLKEIAEELGKSHDAAKQKHHRCLEQLRKLLGDDPATWFD